MSTPDPGNASVRESNLFDVLRLVAAALVIVGHAWPLSGASEVPTFAGIRIHHLGVYIFFVISGYLLATSWDRRPQPLPFLVRRCLRIFPALIIVVTLTVVVIGPLATAIPAADYWTSSDTWQYLLNITLLAQYELPGLFEANPEHAVNGSLWSLGVEFCCYLMLVVTALLGIRAKLAIRVLLAAAVSAGVLSGLFTGALRTTAIAVIFFVLGSLVARGGRLADWPVFPALIGLVMIAPLPGWIGTLLAWPVVTYAVIAVGSRRSRAAGVARRAGDPSYGMYLWGFPIQQIFVAVQGAQPIAVNIAVVLPVAVVLGYASWWLIEKPTIALGARMGHRHMQHPSPIH